MTTVGELSEAQLLAQIAPWLPGGEWTLVGPGDDCAVVAAPDGRYVVTTDVLVAGRHFRAEWSTGFDVGWRAAMVNLADVAAMGAAPTALVVGLAMPTGTEVAWMVQFVRGLTAATDQVGGEVGVVGGDLSQADQVFVSVTAHGDLAGRAPVLRSGARPGDLVAHAGVLGWSAAGLALLVESAASARSGFDQFVAAHLRPDPPVRLGVLAALAGATAMIDVSDGLLLDASRVAAASGVGIDLHPEPLAAAAAQMDLAARVTGGREALAWVLSGGEDHGLLATFPPEAQLPAGFIAIGTVVGSDPGVYLAGRPQPPTGWDHFRGG